MNAGRVNRTGVLGVVLSLVKGTAVQQDYAGQLLWKMHGGKG